VSFGTRLKALRVEKGLSQKELGQLVDLESQTISHYETGYRSPSIATINRFCEVFNVTSDYLLDRSDYRQYPTTDIRTIASNLIDEIQEAARKANSNLKES
jgi:transcriptional regulator with XRE-family HTH domain